LASGDPVVQVLDILPPTTLFAVLTRRVGASAPAEGQNVWAFDATTTWYLDFLCALRGYGGGGLTFTLPWTASTSSGSMPGFHLRSPFLFPMSWRPLALDSLSRRPCLSAARLPRHSRPGTSMDARMVSCEL
jgi:hypothetical protein